MCKWPTLIGLLFSCLFPSWAWGQANDYDTRLAQAEQFVQHSDRYMHHSRLHRGMKGYGLTVMAGTKIERFDVEILSVLTNYAPHQDVILCNLSGLGLEKTGVIEGMSGSPVYIKDPLDGKDKIIGAVAYGWQLQKEPICGLQPITQMLALQGVPLPRSTSQPVKVQGTNEAAPAVSMGGGVLDEKYSELFLDGRKLDFARLSMPKDFLKKQSGGNATGLSVLGTPLMISGGSRSVDRIEKAFAGTGLTPMRSGSAGGAISQEGVSETMEPGSPLSVPLVTGDADWSAVGTVTDVLDGYVLGFGHCFLAKGKVEMPMGPAYIHGVVPSLMASFKLGSTIRITGVLTDDENTGVGGVVGQSVSTVPMTLTIREGDNQVTYHYNLIRHRWLTALTAASILKDSLVASRELPDHHWLSYEVGIDFGQLGQYRSANSSSDDGGDALGSDVSRPLAAMMNTELGDPAIPQRIDVTVNVQPVKNAGTIVSLELDKNSYRPGQTVQGKLTIRPFRAEKITRDVSMELPCDLPDGTYMLTTCDAQDALMALRHEMPQRFVPKTVKQLFAAVQDVVDYKSTSIYVRLPLHQSGLAVKKHELDSLPGSMADILNQAEPDDSRTYQKSLVHGVVGGMVLSGSADAKFTVCRQPSQQSCE